MGRHAGADPNGPSINQRYTSRPASAALLDRRLHLRVTADYQTYLGRHPAAAEVQYWVGQFRSGVSNEDVVAGFVGSSEFYHSSHGGQGNRQTWITNSYLETLHRMPRPDEIAYWNSQLQ